MAVYVQNPVLSNPIDNVALCWQADGPLTTADTIREAAREGRRRYIFCLADGSNLKALEADISALIAALQTDVASFSGR
jgi:hypothetical protein